MHILALNRKNLAEKQSGIFHHFKRFIASNRQQPFTLV
jgi:hypothetical protein